MVYIVKIGVHGELGGEVLLRIHNQAQDQRFF